MDFVVHFATNAAQFPGLILHGLFLQCAFDGPQADYQAGLRLPQAIVQIARNSSPLTFLSRQRKRQESLSLAASFCNGLTIKYHSSEARTPVSRQDSLKSRVAVLQPTAAEKSREFGAPVDPVVIELQKRGTENFGSSGMSVLGGGVKEAGHAFL